MTHISSIELQDYVDRTISGIRKQQIEHHLGSCSDCASRVRSMESLDRLLRRIPHERTSLEFTGRVLRQLGIRESPPVVWALLRHLAPAVALVIVIAAASIVFSLSGMIPGSEVQPTGISPSATSENLGNAVSQGVSRLNTWIGKYLSFAFARGTYAITVFILLFFGIVALLDKYIFMPMIRRRG